MKNRINNLLPSTFKGEILQRGDHDELPVIVECTDKFISENLTEGNFWWYGSWAYIIPKDQKLNLSKWTKRKVCNDEFVQEFFSKILAVFWVKYELEGIWIMSHKLNTKKICETLCVKDVNNNISQIIVD